MSEGIEIDVTNPVLCARANDLMARIRRMQELDLRELELLRDPDVQTALRYHVILAIALEREACARTAEAEAAMPGSPWVALGFWRCLKLFVLSVCRPWRVARRWTVITRSNIARAIRARGQP